MEEKEIIKPEQGVSTGTIARTICLFLALANQVMAMCGITPIDLADDIVYQAVTIGATVITALIAWWKNNSFTQKAIEADKTMKK